MTFNYNKKRQELLATELSEIFYDASFLDHLIEKAILQNNSVFEIPFNNFIVSDTDKAFKELAKELTQENEAIDNIELSYVNSTGTTAGKYTSAKFKLKR